MCAPECFDEVELSDDERVFVRDPVVVMPTPFVGEVSQDELDAVNLKLNNLRDFVDTLVTKL